MTEMPETKICRCGKPATGAVLPDRPVEPGEDATPEERRDYERALSWWRFMEALPVMCPDCSAEEERKEREREAEEAEDQRRARLGSSNIPLGLRPITWESLTDRDVTNAAAIESAQAWARGEVRGVVLGGPVGTGKTWIAAAAANEALGRGPLDWVPVSRLGVQARAGFKDPAREEVTRMLLRGRTALVLDDIEKAGDSDYVQSILFQAIDERIQNGAPLLVTTNLTYPALAEKFGEPIASRLASYAGSGAHAHRLEGEDRRRRKAAA